MELDEELSAALAEDSQQRNTLNDVATLSDFQAMRRQRFDLARLWGKSLDRTGVECNDGDIPGTEPGSRLRIRTYRPEDVAPFAPCILHLHGGGQVSGTPLMDDVALVPLTRLLNCIAISIDYRLAPEAPAPAAAEDCLTSLRWVRAHADSLGIDPSRIALVGRSGGGAVAAAAALMARDRGQSGLCLLMLIYPMLDDRGLTDSSHGDWISWPKELNAIAWQAVLAGKAGTASISPYQAPGRATDLTRLPPTFIDVGAMELFRDECLQFAGRLLSADVPTELHVYPGCFHGFDLFAPRARVSHLARANRLSALQRAFSKQNTPGPAGRR